MLWDWKVSGKINSVGRKKKWWDLWVREWLEKDNVVSQPHVNCLHAFSFLMLCPQTTPTCRVYALLSPHFGFLNSNSLSDALIIIHSHCLQFQFKCLPATATPTILSLLPFGIRDLSLFLSISSERQFGKQTKMKYVKSWHFLSFFLLRLCNTISIFDGVRWIWDCRWKLVALLESLLSLSHTPDFTFAQLSFGSLPNERLQLR